MKRPRRRRAAIVFLQHPFSTFCAPVESFRRLSHISFRFCLQPCHHLRPRLPRVGYHFTPGNIRGLCVLWRAPLPAHSLVSFSPLRNAFSSRLVPQILMTLYGSQGIKAAVRTVIIPRREAETCRCLFLLQLDCMSLIRVYLDQAIFTRLALYVGTWHGHALTQIRVRQFFEAHYNGESMFRGNR